MTTPTASVYPVALADQATAQAVAPAVAAAVAAQAGADAAANLAALAKSVADAAQLAATQALQAVGSPIAGVLTADGNLAGLDDPAAALANLGGVDSSGVAAAVQVAQTAAVTAAALDASAKAAAAQSAAAATAATDATTKANAAQAAAVAAAATDASTKVTAEATVRAAQDALNIPRTLLGAPSGVPQLDANGLLVAAQLPPIAIGATFDATSDAQMTALNAQTGDICIRDDVPATYRLVTSPATTLANWRVLPTSTSAVSTVAGRRGDITLSTADVSGLGTAATHAVTDFDASGAAASAQSAAATDATTKANAAQSAAISAAATDATTKANNAKTAAQTAAATDATTKANAAQAAATAAASADATTKANNAQSAAVSTAAADATTKAAAAQSAATTAAAQSAASLYVPTANGVVFNTIVTGTVPPVAGASTSGGTGEVSDLYLNRANARLMPLVGPKASDQSWPSAPLATFGPDSIVLGSGLAQAIDPITGQRTIMLNPGYVAPPFFDSAGGGGQSASVATMSWSHTVGVGPNRFLLIAAGRARGTNNTLTVSGITYAGVALTQAGMTVKGNAGISTERDLDLWYLLAPPVGTASVVVTATSPNQYVMFNGSASFFGVNQSNPFTAASIGTLSSAGTANPSIATTGGAGTDLLVGAIAYRITLPGTATPSGTGQLTRTNQNNTANAQVQISTQPGGAGTQTTAWTTPNADTVAGIALALHGG